MESKYQVIVCTHTNKKNIHNHIVLNSVSFIDGSKYHNSNVEIALLRQTNDDICRKHGLSIIKSTEATKYQEFIDILAFKGYYIKKSNNVISVSTPYYNRNIRLARAFGEDYTFDNIKTRIYQPTLYDRYLKRTNNEKVYKVRIYDGIKIDQEKLKTSSFYRLYVHYLYLLGKLLPRIHYEEIDKFNKLADEMNLICTYNLIRKLLMSLIKLLLGLK